MLFINYLLQRSYILQMIKNLYQQFSLAKTKHMHSSTPFSPSFEFINVNFLFHAILTFYILQFNVAAASHNMGG